MIQNNFNYPKFENGQFLTSELLNSSVGYVEEQGRLTRANLIGVGILDGLTCSFNGQSKELTIKAGTAITPDGFIIQFPKNRTYKYVTTSKGVRVSDTYPLSGVKSASFGYLMSQIEYVWYEDDAEASKYGVGLSGSAMSATIFNECNVALMVYFPERTSASCNQYTCDRNYIQTDFMIRPIMVKKKAEKGFPVLYRRLSEISSTVSPLKQLSNFESALNINSLAVQTKNLYVENANLICECLTNVVSQFAREWKTGKVVCYDAWKTALPNYEKTIKGLVSCLLELMRISEKKKNLNLRELPQYFLLFLEDMRSAINEFISFYNTVFVRKYPFLRTSQNMIDRVVVIGKEQDTSTDVYHYLFRPVGKDLLYENVCSVLDKLLSRIYKLSEAFVGLKYAYMRKEIGFSMKNSSATMGENEIPYYYDESVIRYCWNPFSIYMEDWLFQKICYSQREPDYLLFRNCYGKKLDDVKGKLESYLAANRMSSIKVETCMIREKRLGVRYYEILTDVFAINGKARKAIELLLTELYNAYLKRPREFGNKFVVLNEKNKLEEISIDGLSTSLRRYFLCSKGHVIIRKNGSSLSVSQLSASSLTKELRDLITAQRRALSTSRADSSSSVSVIPGLFRAKYATILKVGKALSFRYETPVVKLPDGRLSEEERKANLIVDAIKNAHNAGPVSKLHYATLRSILSEVSFEDFEIFFDFIRGVFKNSSEISGVRSGGRFRNLYFSSFLALKSYVQLGFDMNYNNAVYCGGANRDCSSIVLFYHRSKGSKRFILEAYIKKV